VVLLAPHAGKTDRRAASISSGGNRESRARLKRMPWPSAAISAT